MKDNYAIKFLGENVTVTVDRPIGSKHPKYDMVYPINYGYIEGVKAPDGGWLDAYILGVDSPLKTFIGNCIAVIHRLNDQDDKLIVVPKGKNFSDNQIKALTNFQEQYFKSSIIRK